MNAPSPTTATEFAHIVCTPGIVGGEPRVDGTRIRVRDIVLARDAQGLAAEEIATAIYPQLSLGQVYAALGYYEDHRSEIDELQKRERELLQSLRDKPPSYV